MSLFSIILISIGLAMDAFAVTIAKTIADCRISKKESLLMITLFGLFQGIMPLIGWTLGINFERFITSIDHWIAFFLLLIIGLNMIRESFQEEHVDCSIDLRTLFTLALATSIDALAVGVSFAFLDVNIIQAALIIMLVTFMICLLGLLIGKRFGKLLEHRATLIGGIILIMMGTKILFEHLLS